MKKLILTTLAAALCAGLVACKDKTPAPQAGTASAATTAPATEAASAAPAQASAVQAPASVAKDIYSMAGQAHGFAVGQMMAANTVYVFFDPTCPHCAEFWKASKDAHSKVKMVWIPVSLLRDDPGPKGATILSAADPVAKMEENETKVLSGAGGIEVPADVSKAALDEVKANTEIFSKLEARSVPFIVYKNAQTGQAGTHAGGMPATELLTLIGL